MGYYFHHEVWGYGNGELGALPSLSWFYEDEARGRRALPETPPCGVPWVLWEVFVLMESPLSSQT
jgi:hypothetical protein